MNYILHIAYDKLLSAFYYVIAMFIKVRWNPPPSQGGICNVSYFYTNMVTQLLNPQWEDSSKLCNRFHFSLQLSSKLTALGKWGFHQKSYQSQQLCFNHHCWFNGIAGDPTGSYYFIFHFSLVISIYIFALGSLPICCCRNTMKSTSMISHCNKCVQQVKITMTDKLTRNV